jgi:hypothetical protein
MCKKARRYRSIQFSKRCLITDNRYLPENLVSLISRPLHRQFGVRVGHKNIYMNDIS